MVVRSSEKGNGNMNNILLIGLLVFVMSPAILAQGEMSSTHKVTAMGGEMSLFLPDAVAWKAGPASLPAGAKMAILEGDPTKAGNFTMRLMLPDGYTIKPHFHSNVEHVTVVSGSFNIGMGEKFDKASTKELTAGSFGFWPAGMRHFAWANGDTVLQLHGVGPWTITYVNASDDPRTAKKN
jgi:quercetin dioxygenase-like cupin family protein